MKVLCYAVMMLLIAAPTEAAIGAVVVTYTCKAVAFRAIQAAGQQSHQAATETAESYTDSRACMREQRIIFRHDGETLPFPPMEFIPGDIVNVPKEKQEWKVKFYTPFSVAAQQDAA